MPAERRPSIVVVRDPHDTPATRSLLDRVDQLDRGVLVVRPVPGTTSPAVLALAILAALGKQVDPPPRGLTRRWWALACAWAAGHQVDYLVIDRAHTLPARLITQLIELAADIAAIGVWFIDPSPQAGAAALADLAGVTAQPPLQLLNLTLNQPDRPAQPRTGPHIAPLDLPPDGFLTFRYACQRRLPAADRALVDDAWLWFFDDTRRWLHQTQLLDHTVRPDPQRLIAATLPLSAMLSVRLAALFYTARHHTDAMLRLRATQAALFREGILLHHEPRNPELPDPGLGSRLTPDVAAAISHTVSTAAATAAVLHLINPLTGLGYPVPRPPVLADLAADGSQLLTAHAPVPVPACAQSVLRAHRHLLDPTGAAPDTALFAGERATSRELAAQGLRPLRLTSDPGPRYRRSRAYLRGHATDWMRRRGLELCALAEMHAWSGHL